jgi:hypothetical protein
MKGFVVVFLPNSLTKQNEMLYISLAVETESRERVWFGDLDLGVGVSSPEELCGYSSAWRSQFSRHIDTPLG